MKKWRCTVCGQEFEGSVPPAPCPVCGAGADAFEERPQERAPGAAAHAGERYVIIGGGIAALEAAKAIRKRDTASSLVMLSGEECYPYNRPRLSAYIAGGGGFESLLLEKESYYAENNIDLRRGVKATAVDANAKTVTLSDGGSLPYTKLLLATGSNPFNPIQSGPDTIPVKVLRRYEDAVDLAEHAKGSRIVLVGGGILGLEAASSLHQVGAKVTVVEFAPRILSLQADEAVSAKLAETLQQGGIDVICGHSVKEATATGALLDDGTALEADMIVASMGVRSETTLAAELGLSLGRGIQVDEWMHTSAKDIWAAGDCAEYDGRVQANAGAARTMGAVAGAAMAGEQKTPYRPFVSGTLFSIFGFSLFSAGDVAGEPDEDIVYHGPQEKPYRRLLFRGGALVGALYVGRYDAAATMKALADKASPEQAVPLLAGR